MARPSTALVAETRDNPQYRGDLVARSPAMHEVCRLLAKVGPTRAAVLIHGEPGTGKELVARELHRQSPRAEGPFVKVNCGAIRKAELAATLFGRKRQAAEAGQPAGRGMIERARRGTLFLANVERLPRWSQRQLLAALQEQCLSDLDGLRCPPPDVRLAASTTCDLQADVAKDRFDGYLYYVLSVVTIHVPPLRQRREDIPLLIERCLAQLLAQRGVVGGIPYRCTPEAWQCLLEHDWPGNLPELAAVVARAVALADGRQIDRQAIVWAPRQVRPTAGDSISVPLVGALRQIERQIIEEVIERYQGNKAAAARSLGLHRRTLYRRLCHDLPEWPR
jgi:DNA-binding NtrC family response regulator